MHPGWSREPDEDPPALVLPWCLRRSHEVRQVEPRDSRASTGLTKGPGLSDHLEARSTIQQGRHEAPAIDLMFNQDDTDPCHEIFPSILFGLWYRNPQAHTRPLPYLAFDLQSTVDHSGPLFHAAQTHARNGLQFESLSVV